MSTINPSPPIKTSLLALVVLYAAARVLQAFPDRVPTLLIVALHVLPLLAFALLHGALVYHVRGILIFLLLCFAVGNFFENLSIFTGFPFGHYHFTDVMGPKLFQVPIMLGLAYVGMGYLSWTLGRIILGNHLQPLTGSAVWMQPLVAAFPMVAWDLSMDPIWTNLGHAWVWHDGGPYFGVPVSNFFGWYLTVYVIYQLFALYLRDKPFAATMPKASWQLCVLLYGISAAGNLLVRRPPGVTTITSVHGAQWPVSSMLTVSALVSILVMGAFVILAWVRLAVIVRPRRTYAGSPVSD